jgi:hypothetical protein
MRPVHKAQSPRTTQGSVHWREESGRPHYHLVSPARSVGGVGVLGSQCRGLVHRMGTRTN